MSAALVGTVIIVLLASIVLHVGVLAVMLRIAVRLCKTTMPSWPRTFSICMAIALTNMAIALCALPLIPTLERMSHSPTATDATVGVAIMLTVAVLILVAVPAIYLKWFLGTSWLRSLLAGPAAVISAGIVEQGIALTLKLTLIETFVIPTGAMAPTIIGRHVAVVCDQCEFTYAVGRPERADSPPEDVLPPSSTTCPNCAGVGQLSIAGRIRKGDRILVGKISQLERWDLIVFRYPEGPSTNFVKRLVGLPDETVEIFAGDVFVDGVRLRKDPQVATDMWLLVHDTRHVPIAQPERGPGWRPKGDSSGWRHDSGSWECNASASKPDWLEFSQNITDHLAYNGEETYPSLWGTAPRFVGDVKIECQIEKLAGTGCLGFQWEYAGFRVTASVDVAGNARIASTDLTTEDENTDTQTSAEASATVGRMAWKSDRSGTLSFAFRDGQAYVLHNGDVVASLGVLADDLALAKRSPVADGEPCRIGVFTDGCSVKLEGIRLLKDIHYLRLNEFLEHLPVSYRKDTTQIALGPDEYWVLGDNSSRSKDSRFWGAVTEGAVIGVARWIYWPPSRCHQFQ